MHAIEARKRGYEVVQLEREREARGASVRNFGLVWVSGRRPGVEVRLALRARQLWEEIAALAPGTGFRPHGSMTLASSEAELHVLKEALGLPDAEQRGFELLDPAAVRAVNPALRGEYLGGLWCRTDAIVEPRVAQPALRAYLLSGGNASPRTPTGKAGGYQWLPGREAVEIAPNGVRDHTGTWHHGDLVVLCTGATLTGIAGPHLAGFPAPPVRRVRLQMMQTRPLGERLTTSVADGDSLRYYPAYDLPGRQLLPPQAPVAAQ